MSILTLSGWTQPTNALADIIEGALGFDYSNYVSPEKAIEALQVYKNTPNIVAWSMGGWLALQAIAAGALAPRSLLLIAPPFQFVNDANFHDGMPPDIYAQFRENYATQPERTSTRFHGLVAKGDKYFRAVMERLGHHHEVTNTERWLPWLDRLSQSNLGHIAVNTPKITLIHGEEDAIVPVAQSTHLAKRHPQMQVCVWKEVSHAPHFHDTERFLDSVKAAYVN